MLSTMSSEKISEYMIYNKIDGIGDEKLVFMVAQLTALLSNVNGGKAKIADFIPIHQNKKVSIIDKIKAVFSGSGRNQPNS